MAVKNLFLLFAGTACGVTVSAGIFTFITSLGIVTRLAQITKTADSLMWYETWISIGAVSGNLWWLFMSAAENTCLWQRGFEAAAVFEISMIVLFGFLSGVFTGCLIGAVAEILNAFPIMLRRIGLKEGTAIVVLMLAAGKFAGVILQFF